MKNHVIVFFAIAAFLSGRTVAEPRPATMDTPPPQPRAGQALRPLGQGNYSFAYWRNGWRKHANDPSADLLCFETGHYGLSLDLADFRKTRFGFFQDSLSYSDVLAQGTRRMDSLPAADFLIELETGGTVYRALSCRAAEATGEKPLQSARLWESGKLVQHYDLLGLIFKDEVGQRLACKAKLDIVVWPDAMAFNLEIAPSTSVWEQATVRMQLNQWKTEAPLTSKWKAGSPKTFTMACDPGEPIPKPDRLALSLSTEYPQQFPVSYRPDTLAYVAKVPRVKRRWSSGYTDIRDYDDFDIVIENKGEETYVPFLFDCSDVANITGLCPMLCDENGRPTGIPVQLSKNWHHPQLGEYLRAYALIPAKTGTSNYTLRICYGFYGTLPSATHAQLSLVGYGNLENSNNGRWCQLAIGCWGETICLDMDQSCVENIVTDVRMLMTRNGSYGKMWNWSDAGWGGDWLDLQDHQDRKLYLSGLKTAYRSHGPCLTDVRYHGFYGSERAVDIEATVRTLRTDDYARTFQSFHYGFQKSARAAKGSLFTMGRTGHLVTPTIAYGNRDGLIEERQIPLHLETGSLLTPTIELSGPAPWWISFPDGKHSRNFRRWGTGTRGLIIRSYEATTQGQTHTIPTIRSSIISVARDGRANLNLQLTPPEGLDQFEPGDRVSFDAEWITIPRVPEDYYGPNESFRQHLQQHPTSWQTVYREAKGNDLQVDVSGGTLQQRYPLILQATEPGIGFSIQGGVGAVPVQIGGLKTPHGSLYRVEGSQRVKFDPSVHGNDYWQTDYDSTTDRYSLTFNLPLDGQPSSQWFLQSE